MVIPLQKKKGDTSLMNYEPISVLPILSKIIERLIKQQLMDHVIQHNLVFVLFIQLRMCYYMLRIPAIDTKNYVGAVLWIFLKHLIALIMKSCLPSCPFMVLTRVYSAVVEKLSYPSSMFTKMVTQIGDILLWEYLKVQFWGLLLFALYINDLPNAIK